MKPLLTKNEWPMLAVYDIEATEWVNITCIGHVDEYGNRKAFKDMPSYLRWLYSPGFQGNHVWAHWGGHYDHRFVIDLVTRLPGWSWQTIQSGNLLIIIKVRAPNGKEIKFCESARLMPDSVEKIGKTVGLLKLDVDRSHMEKLTLDETITYCMRDCDIVLRGLQYMRDTLNSVGCDFAYTLASISTRFVRRSEVLEWIRFYEKDEVGKHVYSKRMLQADEFCLPAYFGGRVEVFKAGIFRKKLYYYDITSSYPWSMLHGLPTYFTGFEPPPRNLRDALNHCGISDATVIIPQGTMHLPLLPIRHNNKLIFAEGTLRGRWTNLELKALWERTRRKGVKIIIHGQARYTEYSFLRPFIETFYNLRLKAKADKDEFRSYTFKIALNSLYGKLVEDVERLSILYGKMVTEAIKSNGVEAVSMTPTPGIYKLTTTSLGPFRHVAAGAYITARSRVRLLEGMEACIKEKAQVYYCDTDSIITDKKIEAFDTPVELGGWELEEELDEAEFICPKVYRMVTIAGKTIYKVKGMPIKGLSDAESRLRWLSYTSELNEDAMAVFSKLSPTRQKEVSSKEGLSGFNTDLAAGSIKPRMLLLSRKLRNTDSKRIHSNGASKPLFINMLEAVNE